MAFLRAFDSSKNRISSQRPPGEPEEFDLAIALDTASQQRLGTALAAIRRANQWINIDHHASNPGYGDLVYIDTVAPAAGQIVFEFLRTEKFPLTQAGGRRSLRRDFY